MDRPGPLPDAATISLLGGVRITTPDAELEGEGIGRRAQVVLASLAVEPGLVVPRALLAEAVWGETTPGSWQAALRNVIADLRRGLTKAGVDTAVAVLSDSGGYRLALGPGSSVDLLVLREDVRRVKEAAREGDDRLAAQLATSALSPAPGIALPGGNEEWVEVLRLEVEELRDRLERALAEAALGLGDAARAEEVALGLVRRSPLREDGHRLLIRALQASGNRAAALEAYDRCRVLMAEELGVPPAAQTQALFLELLGDVDEEEVSTRPGRDVRSSRRLQRARAGGTFVGRGGVLADLEQRLELVRRVGMMVVTLWGEAGVGKTRLAAELAGRAEEAGVGVLYGRADDRVGLPYAALLDALDADAGDLQGAASDPADARATVGAALRGITASGPVLLVLDDVQWASRAELDVLAAVLEEPADVPLLALVLHRAADDAAMAALGGGPRIERLALEHFGVAEVQDLLVALGSEARDRDDAARLWRLSGGNPLLASEVVRTGWPDARDGGELTLGPLVRRRLAALPVGLEEVLRVAVVAGLEFDPDLVVAASASPADVVRERLAAAADDGLLLSSTGGYEFRHALVRDALLATLDSGERLRIHGRLAAAIERAPAPDPGTRASLAHHAAAAGPAGDWRRALRYARPAAVSAFDAGVFEDVVVLASRTIATLEQAGDPDPGARLDLEVLLGGAQHALGDPRAQEVLTRAFEEAAAREDPARMADAALAFSHAGSASQELYVDHGLLPVYDRALSAQPEAALGRRALLQSRIASGRAWQESGAASMRSADEALSLARAHGDPEVLAAVLIAVRRAMAISQDLDRRERHEHDLAALADRFDDPALRLNVALWRFETDLERGRGDRLEALLRTAADHGPGLRMGSYHHSIAYRGASLALLRGRVADADALVEAAAVVARDHGVAMLPAEGIRLAQLVLVRAEQGRLAELRDEASAFFTPSGHPGWLGLVAALDLAAGSTARVAERLDAMLDDHAARGATTVGMLGVLAFMAATVVRLEDSRRVERLRGLLAPASGFGASFGVGFAGPIDYHLALLDHALGDGEAARERMAAAVAFCARLGAPSWEARCQAGASALDDEP